MKSYPSLQSVRKAWKNTSKFDLSYTHITTTDFFRLQPTAILETVPNDRISLGLDSFVRLSPLALPTFGRIKLHHRAFFVPYRDVMQGFDEFINRDYYNTVNGAQVNKTMFDKVHSISNRSFSQHFSTTSYGWSQTISDLPDSTTPNLDVVNGKKKCDFVYISSDRKYCYRNFTNKGRHIYSLLRSLKININFTYFDNTEISLLPFLCYCKAYLDWYYPSIFYKDEEISQLFNYTPSSFGSNIAFWRLFDILYSTYEADYFTKAWASPVSPYGSDSLDDEINIRDITIPGNESGVSSVVHSSSGQAYGTPTIYGSNGLNVTPDPEPKLLTQYSLNALRSLTNYLTRNHVAGFRPLSRYLLRYGVRLSDDVLRRSRFLGSAEQDVKTTDIMSTSDAGSSSVGDYAGAGASGMSGYLFKNEKFKDFGCIVVITTLIPHTGYCQGRDRMYQHLTPLDFFVPEFDKLGTQAIRQDEVYSDAGLDPAGVPMKQDSSVSDMTSYYGSIWAYTPRYSEYKVSRDVLSGDFCVGTLNENLKPFHLMRDVLDKSDRSTTQGFLPLPYDQKFVTGSPESYNRIFQVISNDMDHFFCHFDFKITAYRPMASLTDSLDITDGGKDIKIPFGGIQVN